MVLSTVVLAVALTVDYTSDIGKVRPELHSSGFGPTIESCSQNVIGEIKSMGFKYARTHDWALTNPNQRICDYHQIFPLIHLDAKDPQNYYFKPTDYVLKRTREEAGLDVFFRLGASIEHSGNTVHFNTKIPEDFEKVAEVFAGTIRHYNKGWADGFNWNIKYWEIWNEPDGRNNMWCLPDGDLPRGKERRNERDVKRRELFVKFFVTCLKRIKSEFPDVKVGGPALCSMNSAYFHALLAECKKQGVAPDFISWHHYTGSPQVIMSAINNARKICDQYGFKDCELIIDEWHYMGPGGFGALRSPDPKVRRKVWAGPESHNGIKSSCFNLYMLSKFQTSKLSQAYYYGCRHTGPWGYKDAFKKYKVYYGLKMFGDFCKDFTVLCKSSSQGQVSALAARNDDGSAKGLIVVDFTSGQKEIVLNINGIEGVKEAEVLVHDNSRDLEAITLPVENGKLVLNKTDDTYAAFAVRFK